MATATATNAAPWRRHAPTLALLAGLLAWLWPFGIGGRMPVGGDVTQFSIGLMAVLHRAIRAGRLPLWNDLWGYGFPGLAESQMGVFYPPHLLLYGLLPVEAAYTASLALHTLWAGLGTAWAARRFGATPWGSTLAGWAFAAGGFFVIHFPHQWGYTVGSWMPWAWGLAWSLVNNEGSRRTALTLAAILAIQMLPGHFQLAFETQVGVLALVLWGMVERRSIRGIGWVVAALAPAAPLAAAQLWPTYRLATLAESRRDYEYLSGFALTPLHLVNYVAPGLFHRAYQWRPWVWDPFRTSPEEVFGYIGLVPLWLALGTIGSELRRDRAVRALTLLALLTLWLALGPNVPGFSALIRLPGFSFFRAPARWSLASSLALALLAGRGLCVLGRWRRPGAGLALFVAMAIQAIATVVVWVEYGIPLIDPRTAMMVANPGLLMSSRRWDVYLAELGPTVAGLIALVLLIPLARRPMALRPALLALTLLDLVLLGRLRPVMDAPIRPLTEQSAVLARLVAREPRGLRIHQGPSSKSNLLQVAGMDSLPSYRTLDLPVAERLTRMVSITVPPRDDVTVAAMRLTGTALLILDPVETSLLHPPRSLRAPPPGSIRTIDDPVLAAWMYRRPWWIDDTGIEMLRVSWLPPRYTLWSPAPASSAWLLPEPQARSLIRREPIKPREIGEFLRLARPLAANRPVPERVEIAVHADGPSFVVLSQLDYPEWRATWEGPGGVRPATIERVFGQEGKGAWQGLAVPGAGDWTLRLVFEGRDVRAGLIVSALAWTLGILAWFWPNRLDGGGERR